MERRREADEDGGAAGDGGEEARRVQIRARKARRRAGGAAPVPADEWRRMMAEEELSREELDRLVMNYLVVEGYQDVAERFQAEAGVEPEIPLSTISERMGVRKAIHAGRVHDAIERVNDLDPDILDTRRGLCFHLHRQCLVELIRGGADMLEEALRYAQDELSPLAADDLELLAELEEAMVLLAFDNPEQSPAGHLLSQSQRQAVATELNEAILESQCESREARLPRMLRRLVWTQEQLARELEFPRITELATASFGDEGGGGGGVNNDGDDPPPS